MRWYGAVSRVAWCEGAKPEGSKQVLFNFLHHLSGPIPGQDVMRQADSEDLVRADRGIG
jgi:hypothetical protein